ncbi:MAG TPA: MerR family transcriptional regulator, partial [Solirubrobacteraceae bacterium]
MTLKEAAERVGVTPATLRRWVRAGLIPQYDGEWTPSAVGHARVVARMRERGHSVAEIRRATEEGRLASGFLEDLFPPEPAQIPIAQAARDTGLESNLIRRLIGGLGISADHGASVSEDEMQLLRYVAAVLETGFPLVALLQLVRVYGQAMARVADAEVRLFHLYVHEPLLRSGSAGVETAEQMHALSREVLPLAGPVLDQIHQRYLQHFVEQDVVGHMEADLSGGAVDLGRMRVAIAFADLTGYTRLTEEEGELTAVDAVERFVEAVENTLPEEARVIKTI